MVSRGGVTKNESIFIGRKSENCAFDYLIEDRISSEMVEKYLFKAINSRVC